MRVPFAIVYCVPLVMASILLTPSILRIRFLPFLSVGNWIIKFDNQKRVHNFPSSFFRFLLIRGVVYYFMAAKVFIAFRYT